jgi:hypothetical protein
MKAIARSARLAALALLAASLLLGCQDAFNAIFDNAAPTGVSASDGEHANSIEVSWSAPNLSSDKWKDDSVIGYTVSWDAGLLPNSGFAASTSFSIKVDPEYRAVPYNVTVETILKSGAGGRASDTGFALETEPMIWADGGKEYTIAGVDRWYVTMLQKDFTYSFAFSSDPSDIEFCPYKSLSAVHTATDSGSARSWKCDEDGASHKFYIHVMPGSANRTFRASYAP